MALTILKKGVGSATFEKETKKEVFPLYDRQHYSKKYKGMESVLRGDKVSTMMGGGRYNPIDSGVIQDIPQYRKDMETAKYHYAKGHAIPLTPDVKNALWRKAKLLKDRITIGMVSKRDLHPVRIARKVRNGVAKDVAVVDESRMRATKAVERNKAWYKKSKKDVQEFKRIMRVLEPDDKNITKIVENWRPEK